MAFRAWQQSSRQGSGAVRAIGNNSRANLGPSANIALDSEVPLIEVGIG